MLQGHLACSLVRVVCSGPLKEESFAESSCPSMDCNEKQFVVNDDQYGENEMGAGGTVGDSNLDEEWSQAPTTMSMDSSGDVAILDRGATNPCVTMGEDVHRYGG